MSKVDVAEKGVERGIRAVVRWFVKRHRSAKTAKDGVGRGTPDVDDSDKALSFADARDARN
jgi:hypothetical protein